MVRDIVINMGECDGFAKLIVMAGGSLWRMIVMARVYCSGQVKVVKVLPY